MRAPSVRSAQRKSWCLPFSRCSKPTTAADLSPSCAISTASQHPTGSVFPSQTTVQRAETRGGDVVSPGCLISSPCPSSCRFPRGGEGGEGGSGGTQTPRSHRAVSGSSPASPRQKVPFLQSFPTWAGSAPPAGSFLSCELLHSKAGNKGGEASPTHSESPLFLKASPFIFLFSFFVGSLH